MKTKSMAECERLRARLTDYLLGEVRAEEKEMIRSHLETCEVCRAEARQLQQTLDAVRTALADPEIAARTPAHLSPDRRARLIECAARSQQRIPVRFWIALEAAAAILIVGLVSGVLILPRRSPPTERQQEGHRDTVSPTATLRDRSPAEEAAPSVPPPPVLSDGAAYAVAPATADIVENDRTGRDQAGSAEVSVTSTMKTMAHPFGRHEVTRSDAPPEPPRWSAGSVGLRERSRTAAAEAFEEPLAELALQGQGLPASPALPEPATAPAAARPPLVAARRTIEEKLARPTAELTGPAVDVALVPNPFRTEAHWLHIEVQSRPADRDDTAARQRVTAGDAAKSLRDPEAVLVVRFNPRRVAWWRRIGADRRTPVSESVGEEFLLGEEAGELRSEGILYELGLLAPEETPSAPEDVPLAVVQIHHGRERDATVIRQTVTDQHLVPSFAAAATDIQLAICTAELTERLQRSAAVADGDLRDLADELRRVSLERPSDARVTTLIRLVEEIANPPSPAKADDP